MLIDLFLSKIQKFVYQNEYIKFLLINKKVITQF